MRLVNFSVTNFRSITKAHKVPISDSTILIGRNNEGKSNVLKALSVAMNTLSEHAIENRKYRNLRRHSYRRNENAYYWERDFPIALQERKTSKQSIFRLEFELDEPEIAEFVSSIKSNLNGTLPIETNVGEGLLL